MENDIKTAIQNIRQNIKELASEQRTLNQSRRDTKAAGTGTPEFWYSYVNQKFCRRRTLRYLHLAMAYLRDKPRSFCESASASYADAYLLWRTLASVGYELPVDAYWHPTSSPLPLWLRGEASPSCIQATEVTP